jgi:ATP-binding cassette subfamily B multidrug efflux pump
LILTSRILSHARPYRGRIIWVFLLQLVATIAALYLPSLNAQIIDEGVTRGDTDFIWSTGMTMLIVCLVQVVTAIGDVYFGARTAMAIGRDLRREVYRKVDSLSALELGGFGTATLITRGTNDVQQVQMLVLMTLNFMVSTPIMCVGGIIMALREDAGLSWLVWVSVPVLFVIVGFLVFLLLPLFRLMQDRLDGINSVLREQIVGIRVVRAFVREPFESERYRKANESITAVSVKVGNIFVLMFPVITMVLHLATAAVLWFGGHRVDAGDMQIGSLTAFLQYLLQILMAVMMGVFMVMMVPRSIVCAERITEVFNTVSSQTIATDARVNAPTTGVVEFSGVSFGYPGAERPVLDNVSFTAAPGQTTAIVGSTGAGKTTLINLTARLYDAQQGAVTIDGVPVSTLTRGQLAQVVGLIPQKPYLFSGTFRPGGCDGRRTVGGAAHRDGRASRRPHLVRDRAPLVDDPRRPHHPGDGGGPHRGAGQPRRPAGAPRRLLRPLHVPVHGRRPRGRAHGRGRRHHPHGAHLSPLAVVARKRCQDLIFRKKHPRSRERGCFFRNSVARGARSPSRRLRC